MLKYFFVGGGGEESGEVSCYMKKGKYREIFIKSFATIEGHEIPLPLCFSQGSTLYIRGKFANPLITPYIAKLPKTDYQYYYLQAKKCIWWHALKSQYVHFNCVVDESSSGMEYVDLLRNPERFTGYAGFSAQRVWNNIYKENCFK